jgi:hypothetical protein
MKPGPSLRLRFGIRFLLGLALVIGVVLAYPIFAANLGWVYLARAIQDDTLNDPHLATAGQWFGRGGHAGAVGAGIVAAVLEEEDKALALWAQSEPTPGQLLRWGSELLRRSDYGAAVIFYVGADRRNLVMGKAEGQVQLALGSFCRGHWDRLPTLPRRVDEHCREWLTANEGNLLVNPNFVTMGKHGWQVNRVEGGQPASLAFLSEGATLTATSPSPAATQLCQRIMLPAGAEVRFQADLVVEPLAATETHTLQVDALYIGWRSADNAPQGNRGARLQQPVTRTTFSRDFLLPEGTLPSLLFCPIYIHGRGKVTLYDPQLRLLTPLPQKIN